MNQGCHRLFLKREILAIEKNLVASENLEKKIPSGPISDYFRSNFDIFPNFDVNLRTKIFPSFSHFGTKRGKRRLPRYIFIISDNL